MRLKELREDLDIKQSTIAEYLHIKQNTYSQYENGQRQLPIDVLIMLAGYYNVSTDYILELTDERKPYSKKGIIASGFAGNDGRPGAYIILHTGGILWYELLCAAVTERWDVSFPIWPQKIHRQKL